MLHFIMSETSHYPIDSIIPFRSQRGPIHPFKELKVGQSFFRPIVLPREAHSVRSMTRQFKVKHPGTDFRTQVLTEKGVKGIRVWRTK